MSFGEDGSEPGPEFTGTAFMERWREYNLGSLFGLIRDTMPRDTPAQLPDRTYLDIVARILAANSFPAGDRELEVEDLREFRSREKTGPGPSRVVLWHNWSDAWWRMEEATGS